MGATARHPVAPGTPHTGATTVDSVGATGPGRLALMVAHVAIQCADLEASAPVLRRRPRAARRGAGHGGRRRHRLRPPARRRPSGSAAADGRRFPGDPYRLQAARQSRGPWPSSRPPRRSAPRSLHDAAGLARSITPTYYGAFVRDPDGNNIEACQPHASIVARGSDVHGVDGQVLQQVGETALRLGPHGRDVLGRHLVRRVPLQHLAGHRLAVHLVGPVVDPGRPGRPVHRLQRQVAREPQRPVHLDGAVDHVVEHLRPRST